MADARPVIIQELTQEDMKDPTLSKLNDQLKAMAATINYLQGALGAVTLHANLDLNGNSIVNAGANKVTLP